MKLNSQARVLYSHETDSFHLHEGSCMQPAPVSPEPQTPKAWIGRHLQTLKTRKGVSQATYLAHSNDLSGMADRFAMKKKDFLQATREDLLEEKEGAQQIGVRNDLISRRLKAARWFFDYLIEQGVRTDNPAVGV
jgi:site-specific recombinase XerD